MEIHYDPFRPRPRSRDLGKKKLTGRFLFLSYCILGIAISNTRLQKGYIVQQGFEIHNKICKITNNVSQNVLGHV